MPEVKKTRIIIPTDTLIQIKAIAVKQGTTQNTVINDLIKNGLENIELSKKKVNEPKIKFKDLAGKYTSGTPFSAVEDIRKMRNGEELGWKCW